MRRALNVKGDRGKTGHDAAIARQSETIIRSPNPDVDQIALAYAGSRKIECSFTNNKIVSTWTLEYVCTTQLPLNKPGKTNDIIFED